MVRSVRQGLSIEPHTMAIKVRTLSTVRHPELIALYASAPNHVLDQYIVGFARLLGFGALRSAMSAKVALGELLRLCPGSFG